MVAISVSNHGNYFEIDIINEDFNIRTKYLGQA